MHLEDIALRLGLPKSGVHRLLAALVEQGGLWQDALTSADRLRMLLIIPTQRLDTATGIPDICQTVLDELPKQDNGLPQH